EAAFEGQSTSSSNDLVFRGLDSSGAETYSVNGQGSAKVRDIQIFDKKIGIDGTLDGPFKASNSFTTKGFTPWSVVAVPPTSPAPADGVAVFCTSDNKIYVKNGLVWKSFQLV